MLVANVSEALECPLLTLMETVAFRNTVDIVNKINFVEKSKQSPTTVRIRLKQLIKHGNISVQ